MPKLTKRLIDAAPYRAAGQAFLRDDELPGFALRVTKSAKAFVLEKRIHGRVRRFTIGPYGPLTIVQARKRAQELIGEIAGGQDPTGIRQAQRDEFTFGKLSALYLERHGPRKRSIPNDQSMLDAHLAPWRLRKLSSITRADLVKLHLKVGEKIPRQQAKKDAVLVLIRTSSPKAPRYRKRIIQGGPYVANRVVALVRRMFNLARTWGVFTGDNPATGIEFFKEEKRDRFVKPDEMQGLHQALDQEPNRYASTAFLVLLLTGARRGEVLSMQWADLDLNQATWRIPETKAGRPHTLPLAKPVLKLLGLLPRQSGSPFVFPGRKPGTHLVNVSKAWGRIRKVAKLDDVRIHDLRRTLGSWLVASGESLSLIGKALNHSQVSTTAIYARLQLDPVRVALESNAQRMLTVVRRRPRNPVN